MSRTVDEELLALSARNRAALRDLGEQELLDALQKLHAENIHLRDTLDATMSKVGEWAFRISPPIADEMNNWVRDYA